MPLSVAAKELKVSKTLLKNACRKLGIRKWPFRQLQAFGDLAKPQTEKKRKREENGKLEASYLGNGNLGDLGQDEAFWFNKVMEEVLDKQGMESREISEAPDTVSVAGSFDSGFDTSRCESGGDYLMGRGGMQMRDPQGSYKVTCYKQQLDNLSASLTQAADRTSPAETDQRTTGCTTFQTPAGSFRVFT